MNFEKAKQMYYKAMECEQFGKLDDAVRYYKSAFLLDANICSKINEFGVKSGGAENNSVSKQEDKLQCDRHSPCNENTLYHQNLLDEIREKVYIAGKICEPNKKQNTTHISDLPVEIIHYIFDWIVSDEFDMRSLDKCSQVCRGFYVMARKKYLWKTACEKVWRSAVDNNISDYIDYRDMYLNRLRIETDGCYISKTCYYREGETAFLNNANNPPFHLVKYYRYFRFFADGSVFVLISTSPPLSCLYKLKDRNIAFPRVHVGTYKFNNEEVCVRYEKMTEQNCPIIYLITFSLRECVSHELKCTKLIWKSMSICSNGKCITEPISAGSSRKYPALVFSRVRSYCSRALKPLT